MKKLLLILVTFLFLGLNITFGNYIDHFDIKIIGDTGKVDGNKSYPLIIKAVDKNGQTVTNYQGTVLIFSEADRNAKFSEKLKDNSYTFSGINQGIVYFEKGIKFSGNGKVDIHVYDLDDQTDSLMGRVETEVYGLNQNLNSKKIVDLNNKNNIINNPSNLSSYKITIGNNETKLLKNKFYPIKIEGLNSRGEIVKDLESTILIFSESDRDAKFSEKLEDNSYNFLKKDKGVIYFKNGIKFLNTGKNDIHVYDLDDQTDSLMGQIEVEVYNNEVEKKYFSKIDVKINSFINKNQDKTGEEKLKIYKNFNLKLEKILKIRKYQKYFFILEYIRKKINIELIKIEKRIGENNLLFSINNNKNISSKNKEILFKIDSFLYKINKTSLSIMEKNTLKNIRKLMVFLINNFRNDNKKIRTILNLEYVIENGGLDSSFSFKLINLLERLIVNGEDVGEKEVAYSALKMLIPENIENSNEIWILGKINKIKESGDIDENKKLGMEILKIIEKNSSMSMKNKNDFKAILKILIYSQN